MTMSLRITSLWVGLTKSSWMTRRTFHNEICLVWTRLSQSRSRDWLMMKWRILLRWASIQVPLQRSTTWLHRHLLWQMWARMGHPLNTQFHRKRHFCRFRMRWGKLTVLLHSVISEILKKWKMTLKSKLQDSDEKWLKAKSVNISKKLWTKEKFKSCMMTDLISVPPSVDESTHTKILHQK